MLSRFLCFVLILAPALSGIGVQFFLIGHPHTFEQFVAIATFAAFASYAIGIAVFKFEALHAALGPGAGLIAGLFLPNGFWFGLVGGLLWAVSTLVTCFGWYRTYGPLGIHRLAPRL